MNYDLRLASVIKLQQSFGVGSERAYRIYSAAKEKGISTDDINGLLCGGIIEKKDIRRLLSVSDERVESIFNKCEELGIDIVSIEDHRYPSSLRDILSPPLILYIKGEIPDFNKLPLFCIVGPRKVSQFGAKSAFSLSKRLAKAGFMIVSGGALGSDSYAHKGAIDAGAKTVAVLGCGIGSDYLSQNRRLWNDISENGCLISELVPEAPPPRYAFPIRNRILSGISLGVCVVEAAEKSGAIITAEHAKKQGRDVFAVPGNPTLAHYKGSNRLLRDGAIALTSAMDIIGRYSESYPEIINSRLAYEPEPEKQEKNKKILKVTLSKEAEIVYNNLDRQKFTVDDLLGTGLGIDELLSALTELEFEQLIKPLPGGMYTVCK